MQLIGDLAVGLELEFEGVSSRKSGELLAENGLMNLWEAHTDNSLRPRDCNTEFVFRGPLRDGFVVEAVQGLMPIVAQDKYELSWRCGMHVHVDHRKATRGDVIKETVLGCLLDRVWYGWGNAGRHESKFCVPLSQVWQHMIKDQGAEGRLRGFKYTGLNIMRAYAPDIGTVEYRYASGSKDPEQILEFIGMAQHTTRATQHFETATAVVESFIEEGTYRNWIARYMPATTHAAWEKGLAQLRGEPYPSVLEIEAACGFAERFGAGAEVLLFGRGGVVLRRKAHMDADERREMEEVLRQLREGDEQVEPDDPEQDMEDIEFNEPEEV